MARPKSTLTLHERALAKVERGPQCWRWLGYVAPDGYGKLRATTGNYAAHRLVYEALRGGIPDGMVLDHICHNPACVNPDHLRPVSIRLNVENFTKQRVDNSTGYRGVTFHRASGLFAVRVRHKGTVHSGGYFHTAAEAGEAARILRLKLHSNNDLDRSQPVRTRAVR